MRHSSKDSGNQVNALSMLQYVAQAMPQIVEVTAEKCCLLVKTRFNTGRLGVGDEKMCWIAQLLFISRISIDIRILC
jgi:hypothetical protein